MKLNLSLALDYFEYNDTECQTDFKKHRLKCQKLKPTDTDSSYRHQPITVVLTKVSVSS